jgi:hypothetical protein
MGGSVVNYREPAHEVIEWSAIDLSRTNSSVLWQAYNCTTAHDARIAIVTELKARKEF